MSGGPRADDPVRRVGARIRAVREHRGLTQAELAVRIGRSVNAVSALERGLSKPTFDVLQGLSVALDTPVRDFFTPPGCEGPPPAALIRTLLGAARALPPADLELAAGIVGLMAEKRRGGGAA